eukprot:TRINITY_DN1649_c0_g1_i1.p1 TRINITY_DN1649_c0_g1~~TRINITY_DN1649_c0_g1_i1.p1  ORF type:complete len:108 (-),score=1.35 TRINITY_DN1649_c0_g1_i1:272-595(-)
MPQNHPILKLDSACVAVSAILTGHSQEFDDHHFDGHLHPMFERSYPPGRWMPCPAVLDSTPAKTHREALRGRTQFAQSAQDIRSSQDFCLDATSRRVCGIVSVFLLL